MLATGPSTAYDNKFKQYYTIKSKCEQLQTIQKLKYQVQVSLLSTKMTKTPAKKERS